MSKAIPIFRKKTHFLKKKSPNAMRQVVGHVRAAARGREVQGAATAGAVFHQKLHDAQVVVPGKGWKRFCFFFRFFLVCFLFFCFFVFFGYFCR